jgi:aminobenzoyl-glutamate utilization protein B
MATTLLDMLTNPKIVNDAWTYYKDVQTKTVKYIPFITPNDAAPIHLNKKIMNEFVPQLKNFYYDPTKYNSYLEQLGIKYPTIEKSK